MGKLIHRRPTVADKHINRACLRGLSKEIDPAFDRKEIQTYLLEQRKPADVDDSHLNRSLTEPMSQIGLPTNRSKVSSPIRSSENIQAAA